MKRPNFDRDRLLAQFRNIATPVLLEVGRERSRQVSSEGWSSAHDDEHTDGSLADAAACYAATTRAFKAEEFAGVGYQPYTSYSDLWPQSWGDHWFRPRKSRRRRLVIAAALILAEIDRLDRAGDRKAIKITPVPLPADEAGEMPTAGASAAASPALLAPAEPAAVEGGCGHAPEVFLAPDEDAA